MATFDSPLNYPGMHTGSLSTRPKLSMAPTGPASMMPLGNSLSDRASAGDGAVRTGSLSGRDAVSVGRPMTAQRRLDMLARRAWTQGDMTTVKELAQGQAYRDLWQQPKGGPMGTMPPQQQPVAAPSAPPPLTPPAPLVSDMQPLPIGGANAAGQTAPPLFALPQAQPGDLPPNPFTTPMPGVTTQEPAKPAFFEQNVGQWNVLGANTPKGPQFMNARPQAAEEPPPLVPTPDQVRQHGLVPDFVNTVVYKGKRYPTFTKGKPQEETVKALNPEGKLVDFPAGHELPAGWTEIKPKGAGPAAPTAGAAAPGKMNTTSKGYSWSFTEPKV